MKTRRLDPVLALVDVACRIRDTVLDHTKGRPCPVCGQRTHHQVAHSHVNHSGETP